MGSIEKDQAATVVGDYLVDFENSLTGFEFNSSEAFALVVFVNGCYDTKGFASTKYSALVHFPAARKSATILVDLLSESVSDFNRAVKSAQIILLERNIVHSDFLLSG